MDRLESKDAFKDLDSLFKNWQEAFPIEKRKRFCKDGLMLKPNVLCSEESELWYNSKVRVAFLLKDYTHNDDSWVKDGDCITDVREWLLCDENNMSLTPPRNYKKRNIFLDIALILRGIHVLLPGGYLSEGETEISPDKYKTDSESQSKVKNAFKTIPFCYIETKKEAGTTKCTSKELRNALSGQNSKFLEEELAILRPNVIVCLGSDIFHLVNQILFKGQDKDTLSYLFSTCDGLNLGRNDFTCTINYYPQKGVFLIDGFHPSSRKAAWIIYEKVMSPLRNFINKHSYISLNY